VPASLKRKDSLVPIEFVDFETARNAGGLRMVVVPGVPSPWGEAAKGILRVKQIPYLAVRLDQSSQAMADWTGERSGPVAMLDDDAPRSGWADILLLAERLAPDPSLLPGDASDRALAIGLSHEICGEMGLGWCRRLQGVHQGLTGTGGFPKGIAEYLGPKYGYHASEADLYGRRVVEILAMLAGRLHQQRRSGSRLYFGRLSAVDLYSAAFMALFKPLPPAQCPMPDALRANFESLDPATQAALDPILIEHRDAVYAEHLELPLTL
jgi:glutathione S-transferase